MLLTLGLLTVLGQLKGYPGPWSDIPGAIMHGLWAEIENVGLFQLLMITTIAAGVIGGAVLAVNRYLPKGLRFDARHLLPEALWRHVEARSAPAPHAHRPVWRRWVTRRLLRDKVAIVILTDASEWSAPDLKELRALQALCKARGVTLLTLIHTGSGDKAERALLRPLKKALGSNKAALLITGNSTPRLDLVTLAASPPPLERLLGPGAQITFLDKFEVSVVSAILTLGSTVDKALVLRLSKSRDSPHVLDSVREQMADCIRFLSPSEQDGENYLENASHEDWKRLVDAAQGTLAVTRREDRESWLLVGKPVVRQDLVDSLRAALISAKLVDVSLEGEAAFRAYLDNLIGAGILLSLQAALRALRVPDMEDKDIVEARNCLNSVRRLQGDAAEWRPAGDDTTTRSWRQRMIDRARDEVAKALRAARIAERASDTEAARLFIAAFSAGCDHGLVLERVAEDRATPQAALQRRVASALALFDDRCPEAGRLLCREELLPEILAARRLSADSPVARWLDASIDRAAALARPLGELLVEAGDNGTLPDLLRSHRVAGFPLPAAILMSLAAIARGTAAVGIARLIHDWIQVGIPCVPPRRIVAGPDGTERRLPFTLRLPESPMPATVAGILDLLEKDDAVGCLADACDVTRAPRIEELAELFEPRYAVQAKPDVIIQGAVSDTPLVRGLSGDWNRAASIKIGSG